VNDDEIVDLKDYSLRFLGFGKDHDVIISPFVASINCVANMSILCHIYRAEALLCDVSSDGWWY